jgi:signal transduction histidine kinase
MPERYREGHRKGLERYLATGVPNLDWRSIDLPGLRADGREIPLSISFGEFHEGDCRFFTGIIRDVSKEKQTASMLEFLSSVGAQLASSSLDFKTTLKTVAQSAVPSLADWCAVDIVGGDRKLERLAVAHIDPAKVGLAQELAERYPVDPDAPRGALNVIRTRRTEFVADIPVELLRAVARDERHFELISSLGLRSYVVAPLLAHNRVYGAITLAQAESGRQFTEADVAVIEDLGRRAGLAIHDAGLYREALEANQLLEEQAAELEQQTEEAQALAEELEGQAEEQRRIAADLARKTEEVEKANLAKSQFLASMSHELRTPLNAISGYVELLEMELRGPITDEQRADLARIRLNQQHLLSLINDVLNFAKVDAGRLEYRIERIALDQVLKDCEVMILPQIHARRISYSYEECGEPVFVMADPEKVQQIILNLLGNAVKFTPEGGELTASCDQTDEFGRVHVRDTGIGIESDKLETIFEPFVQVNQSLTRPGGGAGLGLAISRSLARAMNGDVHAVSEPGKGATFSLTLPRA